MNKIKQKAREAYDELSKLSCDYILLVDNGETVIVGANGNIEDLANLVSNLMVENDVFAQIILQASLDFLNYSLNKDLIKDIKPELKKQKITN